MANFIEGIAATGAPPLQFANPAQSLQPGDAPSLSAMGQSMLSGIGRMQSEFDGGVRAAFAPTPDSVASPPATTPQEASDRIQEAARLFAEQIEASTRVQEQLTRFVMASSVSSSLGRNLNMFLRGQ